MGLISTVSNLAKTGANIDTGLSDLKNNVANYLGFSNDIYANTTDDKGDLLVNTVKNNKFFDLRGKNSVFRGKETAAKNRASNNQTFIMGADFIWSDNAFNTISFKEYSPKIQKIYIHEFQPYLQTFLGQCALVLDNAGKSDASIKALANNLLSKTPLLNLLGIMLGNSRIKEISLNPSILYKDWSYLNHKLAMENPILAAKRMFVDGIWLNSYVIPLISKDNFTYINAETKYNGLEGGGGELANLLKFISGKKPEEKNSKLNNITNSAFSTIPKTPTYKPSLKARGTVNTSFYLINKNSLYLVRNYKFLQVFSTSAMLVQLDFGKIHSPNVFYVEIPGKRLMIWAQIQVKVTLIGKYRSDLYAVNTIFKENNSFGIYKNFNYENMLWPLAWQLDIQIHDFTPNTFNTYEHYLSNGSCLTALQSRLTMDKMDEKFKKMINASKK